MDRLMETLSRAGIEARLLSGDEAREARPYAVSLGERSLQFHSGEELSRAFALLAQEALGIPEASAPKREAAALRVLTGTYDEYDPMCDLQGSEADYPRRAIVMQSRDDLNPLRRALGELFPPGGPDIVVESGEGRITVLKNTQDMQEEEIIELCRALLDTVHTEASMRIIIGIGGECVSFRQWKASYDEAAEALRIGSLYHPAKGVYVRRALILESFLQEVPEETLKTYHGRLFGAENGKLLSEEMLHTIERFFECDLNLSEAARRLFIHRNTLVYRLDKFQRAVGLDLRRFDDAVIYKLLYMMGRADARRAGAERGEEA